MLNPGGRVDLKEAPSSPKNPKFISISGVAGSGKTTVANYLKQYFGQHCFSINDFSFAGPLKDSLCMWFGWDRKRLDSDFAYKEGDKLDDGSPDPFCQRLGMTRRVIMQKYGTECMRHGMHPDFWVIMADMGLHLGKIPHSDIYVISDARFLNELEWAKSIDAYRIFVTRAECPRGEDPAKIIVDNTAGVSLTTHTAHASETQFLNWDSYDEVVVNMIDHNLIEIQSRNAFFSHLDKVTIPAIRDRHKLPKQGDTATWSHR